MTSFFRIIKYLNGSLRNFNTWCVLVSSRTLQRDFFGYRAKKIWGPKTTYFRWLRFLEFLNIWMDLHETLTHDVYQSAVEHYKDIFLELALNKIWDPKSTYFQLLHNSMATLRANISSEECDIDNRQMALKTTKGPLHCPKISFQFSFHFTLWNHHLLGGGGHHVGLP